MSADDEDRVMIAQSDEETDKNKMLTNDHIRARIKGDFPIVTPDMVQYTDVAPNQILSVAASLIPFLEHDDANRALMGSNMQRQSVPLMNPDDPIVGTGLEAKWPLTLEQQLRLPLMVRIHYVDSEKIVIRTYDVPEDLTLVEDENLITIYLRKYKRTNQNTSQNQRPIVKEGDKVIKGQANCRWNINKKWSTGIGKECESCFYAMERIQF